MIEIGLAHYGGTLGLYNEPLDEQVRALAHYAHRDKMRRDHHDQREQDRRDRKRRER